MMPAEGDGRFPATHWTLIARIKSTDEAVATVALEELCTQYHYPLYCYLRRRGCWHHDAQDVLHDFLALLFRRRSLDRIEESRGRLRGWLTTAIGRHLSDWRRNEARRANAGPDSERGLDFAAIEQRYEHERFRDGETPDRIFEREWALELLRQAIGKVGQRYEQRGRGALFAVLLPVLEGGGSLRGHDTATLAGAAHLSEEALRTALSRMLRDFRDEMQIAVRLTVEHENEVAAEMTYLMRLFQR